MRLQTVFMSSTLLVLATPLTTSAQPPTGFGQWSASSGTISASCPTGFNCAVLVDDTGFLQRELVDPNTGQTFMQSIITDPGASGAPQELGFADENFISLMGPGGVPLGNGIASHQAVRDGEVFHNTIEINRGWAAPQDATGAVLMDQFMADFANPAIQTDDFSTAFAFENIERGGQVTGLRQRLDQTVGLNQGGTFEIDDWQVMSMPIISGEFQTTSGEATIPGIGTMTWNPGDTIMTGFAAQTFEALPDRAAMGGTFSHQGIANATTGEEIAINSLIETGPFDWPDPLLPEAVFPDVNP